MSDTLLAFNGSAFAVRFSRSAIFFISDFFGDDLASYRNSPISCGIRESPPISGKLLAICFSATMRLLSNYFDLLLFVGCMDMDSKYLQATVINMACSCIGMRKTHRPLYVYRIDRGLYSHDLRVGEAMSTVYWRAPSVDTCSVMFSRAASACHCSAASALKECSRAPVTA